MWDKPRLLNWVANFLFALDLHALTDHLPLPHGLEKSASAPPKTIVRKKTAQQREQTKN